VSNKTWIIFGAIVVLLLGGLIVYSRASNPSVDVSDVDVNSVIAASDNNGNIADHVEGSSDNKITLVEYGDLQCPSCGGAHPNIKAITEEYGDKITFIFRNFPLTTIHPNARAAAAAAEAAGVSGKYWEMHNALFEAQSDWSTLDVDQRTGYFVTLAKSLGIDEAKFKTDLASSTVNKKIAFDQALGNKLKVSSTPTFYFQGEKLADDVSGDTVTANGDKLRALIDAELKKAGVALPSKETATE